MSKMCFAAAHRGYNLDKSPYNSLGGEQIAYLCWAWRFIPDLGNSSMTDKQLTTYWSFFESINSTRAAIKGILRLALHLLFQIHTQASLYIMTHPLYRHFDLKATGEVRKIIDWVKIHTRNKHLELHRIRHQSGNIYQWMETNGSCCSLVYSYLSVWGRYSIKQLPLLINIFVGWLTDEVKFYSR